jgi:hypothetical protein
MPDARRGPVPRPNPVAGLLPGRSRAKSCDEACKTHERRAAARAERVNGTDPGVRSERTNQGTKPGRTRAGGLGVHGCSARTNDPQRGGPGERLVRGIVRWDRTAAVRGPRRPQGTARWSPGTRPAIIRRLCTTSTSVGAWRSLVARIVRDDEVGGSNPLAPTKTRSSGMSVSAPTGRSGTSREGGLVDRARMD